MTVVVGRLGKRGTVLVGAVLMALSKILSSLVDELTPIICLMGILLGLSEVTLISPGEVLMGSYFKKRRFLAMILAKCGASVGNIVLPLLVTFLLEEYGLRGTLLLTGGLCLHCIPAAMLFRPISYFKKQTKRKHHRTGSANQQDLEFTDDIEARKALIRSDLTRGDADTQPSLENMTIVVETKQTAKQSAQNDNLRKLVLEVKGESAKTPCQHTNNANGLKRSLHSLCEDDVTSCQEHTQSAPNFPQKCDFISATSHQQKSTETSGTLTETVSAPDINVAALSAKSDPSRLNLFDAEEVHEANFADKTNNLELGPQRKQDVAVSSRTAEAHNPTMLIRLVKCLKCSFSVDLSLFRSPLFRLLLAYFMLYQSVNIMTSYLPALANENDVTESQVGLLLSLMGGLDFVCRLSCAFIANARIVRVSTLTVIAYFILGVTSQFVPYMTSFSYFLVLSVLLGLLGGVGNVMLPVLVLDFVGLDRMATALGFVWLVAGGSSAAVFPLLGFIRDITGSYVAVYHVIGGAAILAAGFLCSEKWIRRLEHRKESSGTE